MINETTITPPKQISKESKMCLLDKNASGHVHETPPEKAERRIGSVQVVRIVPPTDGGETCGLEHSPIQYNANHAMFGHLSAPNYSAWRTDGGNDRP